MKKDEFKLLLAATFEQLNRLTDTKGEEYSGDDDQLANFKRLAEATLLYPEQAWLVLFTKHIDAIRSYCRTRKTLSEPIGGRIDDAILYLVLLKGLVHDYRVACGEESPLKGPKL